MKKNIIIGGIICLILAVFRLCSLIYHAVFFQSFYPEDMLDIILILAFLIIPGIIGLFGKGNNYYYITSFLGAGYCFFFGLQRMTTYDSNRFIIQGLLYLLLSIGHLVLFILDKCKINDKTHYSYVLSYIGFFCFITISAYPLIFYVRDFPFTSNMPLTDVVWFLALIHIYIIAIITSSFVIVAKFKRLWVSILALFSICVYLVMVLFNLRNLSIFYVLEILITLFGVVFIPFSFVARKVLNNEAEESNPQSNQDVFESVPNDSLEPYEEEYEEEPYEEESYSDSDLSEEKLIKLKSFYEKGLIDEKEYQELRKDVLMKMLK